jgi:hypothetical protein
VRDLPISLDLEAARLSDYDRAEVVRLFREFEFRSLIDRLPPLTGESAVDAAEALRSVAGACRRRASPGGRRRGEPGRGRLGPARGAGRRSTEGETARAAALDGLRVDGLAAEPRADAGGRSRPAPPAAAGAAGPWIWPRRFGRPSRTRR